MILAWTCFLCSFAIGLGLGSSMFTCFGIFLVIQDLWGQYIDPLLFRRTK